MNAGVPFKLILTERQKAIVQILADARLIEDGRRTDGTPFAGFPVEPLALMIDLALTTAATEQDLVDLLSWGSRESRASFEAVARSLMTLYEPPVAPEFADPRVGVSLAALRRDLETTGHGDRVAWVDVEAARAAEYVEDPVRLVQKIVEDVQQRLQDEFVDTTWPACPRHPNHPLNFEAGGWHCPRGVLVARLGELAP